VEPSIKGALRCILVLFVVLSASSRTALADPEATPTPGDVDLARMDAELQYFAQEARASRTVWGLTTLGLTAVLVPTGFAVRLRSDNESHLVGGGLILGGLTPLIPAVTTLFPSKVEGLQVDFETQRAAGRPASEILLATEARWREAAEENRRERLYVGVAGLVLGTAALAAGLVFMLEPSGFGGLDETTQYTLGSAFIGAGVPITTLGLRTLTVPSIEETSWEAYRRMKLGAPAQTPLLTLPSLSVTPARGGGVAVLGARF
jgi:hypothetical protein